MADIQNCSSASSNQIYVARSSDRGQTWATSLVSSASRFTALDNVFPAILVGQATGTVYTTWSDAHYVSMATATDRGQTWSTPRTININTGAAATADLPALARP